MKARLATFLACITILHSAQADTTAHQGIAMCDAPKYADGFDHFDYVNPGAPKGGTLKLNANGSFDSLNPFIVRGTAAAYMTLTYESLMTRSWDEPFSLYGLLAESAQVADDRSSVTFNLNPRARWSDGQPVTVDDVLFSYRTLRDKGRSNHRTYYKQVTKAEKTGERSVTFTFAPNADGTINRELPLLIGLMPVLPEHDWKDRDFNQTTWRVPVGSGPYTITNVDPGRSVTYTRNPDYWGRDLGPEKGLNNFDTIRIDYYRDDNVALEAFKAGQFDLRRESNINKWVTGYDIPAVHDGRVKLERIEKHSPEPAAGFVFNTRRELFKDAKFREALEYTFDSGWINRNLFHNQYHRTESFFPHSELEAPNEPEGKELNILMKYREQLPPSIFSASVKPPSTDGTEDNLRNNLRNANEILREAGYTWRDEKLYAPGGTAPISFEILLNDPAEEKIALTWSRTLQRIGIAARTRIADSAQYQARVASFDFDVTTYKWINTLSPGNEQMIYWGSAAARQPGSRNYAGVNDPVVDALAAAIPAATTRADLVAATHALDRVLMAGHYTIPFYYLGADDIAYWTAHLRHPATPSLYGTVQESWWSEPETP